MSLNLTTQNIKNGLIPYINKYSSPKEIQELQKLNDNEIQRELELIRRNPVCDNQFLIEIRERVDNLNVESYKENIKTYFYDDNLMQLNVCLFHSIIKNLDQNIPLNSMIKEWIRNLYRIGEKSEYGLALSAGFYNFNDIFVMKVPHDPKDSLIHEYVVGIYGTNRLRKYGILNFAYIYGGFDCSKPILGPDKKTVTSWCNTTDKYNVNYVIYENISPSITLQDYIKICTFDEWLIVYLQILYALDFANKKFGFMHNDLHTLNVLLRDVNPNGNWLKYITNEQGSYKYIKTRYIPTIIDYGEATIYYQDESYGTYKLAYKSVNKNFNFPLRDSYKLLMFSIAYMYYNYKHKLIEQIEPIFRIFNSIDNMKIAAEQQYIYKFDIPYNQKLAKITHMELANQIRKIYNINFYDSPESDDALVLLGCIDKPCLNLQETFKIVGGINPSANDVVEFRYIYSLLQKSNERSIEDFIKNFNYEEKVKQANEELNNLTNDMSGLISVYIPGSLYLRPEENIFTEDTLNRYMIYAKYVIYIYNKLERYNLLMKSLIFVNFIYNDEYRKETNENRFLLIIDTYKQLYRYIISNFSKDVQKLLAIKIVRDIPDEYSWYYTEFIDIKNIISLTDVFNKSM
jgi:hypothetical protein